MITLDEVLQLHEKSIRDYGGGSCVCDINTLRTAIARPFQYANDTALYPTAYEKAAAIMDSIIRTSPFEDGNKRTGFLAGFTLLYRAGLLIGASQEAVLNFITGIASSDISFED